MDALPDELVCLILASVPCNWRAAGAFAHGRSDGCAGDGASVVVSPRSVCRRFRRLLPLAALLMRCHSGRQSLYRASRAGHTRAMASLLLWHGPEHEAFVDGGRGMTLYKAAGREQLAAMRLLLLEWPDRATQASCDWEAPELGMHGCPDKEAARDVLAESWVAAAVWPDERCVRVDSWAVMAAASGGSVDALRLLLEWHEHPARADCQDGEALLCAAHEGHVDAMRFLLQWRQHAPRADCREGRALVNAAAQGHVGAMRLLLEWHEHAPRADCLNGEALIRAALGGHLDAMRLLLEWREHAPRADCRHGQALVRAASEGHVAAMTLLLEWREHPPRADCIDSTALKWAAQNNHVGALRLLLAWPAHAPTAKDAKAALVIYAQPRSEAAEVLRQHLQRLDPNPKSSKRRDSLAWLA